MSRIRGISLNSLGVSFANNMSILGEDLCKNIPIIGIKETVCQVFDFVI